MYLVKPEPYNERAGDFEVDAGQDSIPVSGTILAAPVGYPGGVGHKITFPYHIMTDSYMQIDEGLLVDPENVYAVGNTMMNDWVFFLLTDTQEHNLKFGTIVNAPHISLFKAGQRIIVAGSFSHRVVPKMFSKKDLYAVKQQYILYYQE